MTTESEAGFRGNNFYCLFQARRIEQSEPDNMLIHVYLRPMLAANEMVWLEFVASNSDLLSDIDNLLEIRDGILADSDIVRDLLIAGRFTEAEEIETKLDIPNRRAQLWQKMEPLLLEVAWELEQSGINPSLIGGWTESDLVAYQRYKAERSL